jgi:carboxyl-terminal processing protease
MSKTVRYLFVGCLGLVLMAGSFASGVAVGWFLPHQQEIPALSAPTPLVEAQQISTQTNTNTPTEPPQNTATPQPQIQETPTLLVIPLPPAPQPQNTEELFGPFWEVWDLVQKEYVDQPVDQEQMMRGAIRGMLESLGDQHTSYMDPDQFREANTEMQGDYEGIGAWVDTTGEYMVITSPMPGSPAEKAGLKNGDTIIAVDKEDMTHVDGTLVLRKVLGPAGTQVTLTILRKGVEKPFDVTITRAKIILASVESKMVGNNIAYIHVINFADDTNQELEKALQALLAKKPKGLILDLRNNPGGYVKTAIEVVSQFIPAGVVMYEEHGDGTRNAYEALPGGMATQIPLVVLVNEGSASASEIVAGAIQDAGRGKLVGVTTYGKGSVQVWTPLSNDQGAVRITIAHWLTPKGRQIHKIGIEPDIKVELSEEDIQAKLDPQLQKAIDLLSQ